MLGDPPILAAIEELDQLRKSRDDHWQIPRVEGEMLHHIALSANARVIVEVGTSYGFSGLFWGAALQRTGGTLHTIDLSQKKFDASTATFAKAGLAGTIVNHLGDAHAVLGTIAGPIDIAFIDADKPACRAYFEMLWPKLRVGGAIITDNATTHRAELADYMKFVRSLADASSVEVAVGNGIEWTIKVREGMRVHVKLFAVLREAAGVAEVTLELAEGATVREAMAALSERMPALARLLERSAAAVNLNRVSGEAVLRDGDEVALLPPVSGG